MDEERITITLDGLGDITATKGVFNVLAITFSDARKQLHREECFALEAKAEKIRSTIHAELEKRGLYNNWNKKRDGVGRFDSVPRNTLKGVNKKRKETK